MLTTLLGSGDDGYVAGQVKYTETEVADLSKSSDAMGKFLSDVQYPFTCQVYVNGTPHPSVVTKEVDMSVTSPFLTRIVKNRGGEGIRVHHCCS